MQPCDFSTPALDEPPTPPTPPALPVQLDAIAAPTDQLPQPEALSTAIDLSAALEMAAGQNPQVAFAQQRIREAAAQLRAADVLWVPSIRAGLNYNKHDGRIQDVEGNVIEVSRASLYSGLGAQAVGAGSPAVPGLLMSFHMRDAMFQPRIAERTLAVRREASQATLQDTLTDTAVAYMNLLEAAQYRAVAHETLANLQRLGDLTGNFARTGEGLQSDADRVRAEVYQQQIEAARTEEDVAVASARLAQLLSQDPTSPLLPQEEGITPLDFVQPDMPLSELIATGLSNRPELAENRFLVAAAVERLRRERVAPLVPSILLVRATAPTAAAPAIISKTSATGSISTPSPGGKFVTSASANKRPEPRPNRNWLRPAQEVKALDRVAAEVAEAHAQVTARQGQINLAKQGITAAGDSCRRNSERIRNAQGLPIEALQSVLALNTAQRQYVRTVADYNRAQFNLERALGWPINSSQGA